MIHLFFEFHCRSEDNERGIASGHNDPDLSPRGLEEAQAMRERYFERDIAAVYCSDLLRARHTAEIVFGDRDVPITYDARLRECDYGDLNGAAVQEVHARRAEHATMPFPNGESFADCAAKLATLLNDLKSKHEGGTIVIIGHSSAYAALEHLLNGRDLAEFLAKPWPWMDVWRWEADF